MLKPKWNGTFNQIIENTDNLLSWMQNVVFYPMATDTGNPKPEIIKLVKVAKNLNKIVQYAIESGRVSPQKALEIMGKETKIEDITKDR